MDLLRRFRWAYLLFVLILIVQGFYLYTLDIRYIFVMSLSLVPGILYIGLIRLSDVGEKEPRGAVTFAMILGIGAIYPAIYLESWGIELLKILFFDLSSQFEQILYYISLSFLVISVVEEGLKMIAFLLAGRITQENDEPADSIVYAASASAGFALYENYRYVIGAAKYSFEHSYLVGIARTFTAIPIHFGLGLIMGYYISRYRYPETGDKTSDKRYHYLIKAFVIPFFFHGLYDTLIYISYHLLPLLDIVVALVFALALTYFAWKRVLRMRKIVE